MYNDVSRWWKDVGGGGGRKVLHSAKFGENGAIGVFRVQLEDIVVSKGIYIPHFVGVVVVVGGSG